LILFGRTSRNIEGIRMNLSKTAKRFLSSTMAIALAGGSVLAFGSSSLADDTADDNVSYTGTVPGECSLTTASASSAGTATTYGETRGLSLNDLDDPTTVTPVTRVTQLQATDTLSFDCNTGSVNFTIPAVNVGTPPSPTGTGGSALVGSHTFTYSPSTSTAAAVPFTAATNTAVEINTDNNGDVDITVTSTWAPTSGEELLKGTYTAEATFQVVAN
jgi:hypothetical protein